MNRPKDVRRWLMCAVLPLTACGGGTGQEITSTKPYADLIGARYSVVADTLSAYGVYQSSGDKEIGYITLVPMGIGGSEFAFRRTVPRGQTIRIQSAWRLFPLMERSVYYLVAVENSDLPEGVPVRLQLDRGNEGVDADLNPAVYKKLPKDN
jgi:hypothetical protein